VAVAAFAVVLCAPALAAAAENGDVGAGVDGATVTCAQETWMWTGSGAVTAATDVIATGVNVPAQLGTTIVAIGVSADGLDATNHAVALPVSVGGVTAANGVALDAGGEIVVHGPAAGSSTGPLTVTGATVVVNRCAEVASAPADPAVTSTTVVVTDAGELPSGASGSGGATLPATGSRAVVEIGLLAVAVLSIGLALRWTATAGGRVPGSRRAELPRDRR